MEDPYLSKANIEQLRQPQDPRARTCREDSRSRRIPGHFLRGPTPMAWLEIAAKLPSKAPLALALVIRFESGRQNSDTVKLTNPLAEKLGVSRKAKYAGLKALEAAGLI